MKSVTELRLGTELLLEKIGIRNEKGQTVIEYILVIALVAIVLAILLKGEFSGTVTAVADRIEAKISAEVS